MTDQSPEGRAANLRSSIYLGDDGWWHGRVTMGIRDDGSPDRRHRQGKTKAEVTEKVRELERQRDAGQPSKPGRAPDVGTWMVTYIGDICPVLVASDKMAPRTLDDYRSKNRIWITPLLGQHRLDRLTADHLDRAYSAMYAAGLSSSTVLKIHRILSRAITVAVKRGVIRNNVAKLIDAPEPNDTEVEPLTRTEARRVLATARGRRNAARWSVALALGIRQGEALGLRWSYVDLESGAIRAWFQIQNIEWQHGCANPNACGSKHHRAPCPRNCRQHRHEPDCPESCRRKAHLCPRRTCDPKSCEGHAHRCPKRRGGGPRFRRRKGKSKLTIQCPPALLRVLMAHHAAQAAERLVAGQNWEDHDLVFCQRNGRPIHRTEDWKEWKQLLRLAKVREVRVHDGRHTAATLLIEQGVHIRTVQEILGHSRITITERYTHVASPMARDAAKLMGQALWE
ncbi:tyrosine-type recombinase/integrase [Cryptosporangium japonicum]|uniref:Site-specific integrase n=1 Tax=Cryptosporangium japonicum TaxID=80872 RepID=A0ABP3EIZ1_9ACTN